MTCLAVFQLCVFPTFVDSRRLTYPVFLIDRLSLLEAYYQIHFLGEDDFAVAAVATAAVAVATAAVATAAVAVATAAVAVATAAVATAAAAAL